MKIIIGAGGTGGHIIPAVAVANELRERNWEVVFIGNKQGMEQLLAAQNGFPFLPIKVQKIYRKLTFEHIRFPFLFIYSFILCLIYICKEKPDSVLCTGGFISGPVAMASILLNRKLYFQDGNSYPGLTTRIFSKYAKHIFIASEHARRYLITNKCIVTGNPILKRHNIPIQSDPEGELKLSNKTTKLLVLGGSQGSAVINQVVSDCIESLVNQGINVIWQTGKNHYNHVKSQFLNNNSIHCFDFTNNLNKFYQLADLAISRAGALSIAELQEYRVPTIYIPLPTSAENHQYKNAKEMEELGLGILLEQSNLNKYSLLEAINLLNSNYKVIKSKLEQIPENRAAVLVADYISSESIQE